MTSLHTMSMEPINIEQLENNLLRDDDLMEKMKPISSADVSHLSGIDPIRASTESLKNHMLSLRHCSKQRYIKISRRQIVHNKGIEMIQQLLANTVDQLLRCNEEVRTLKASMQAIQLQLMETQQQMLLKMLDMKTTSSPVKPITKKKRLIGAYEKENENRSPTKSQPDALPIYKPPASEPQGYIRQEQSGYLTPEHTPPAYHTAVAHTMNQHQYQSWQNSTPAQVPHYQTLQQSHHYGPQYHPSFNQNNST